jgi:Mg2+/Co2+ transporter CorC
VLGLVDPPAILAWRRAGKHRQTTLGALLATSKTNVAYPDEYLAGIIDRLMRANVAHMPVISRTDASLVGYLGWKDLLRIRARQHAEEKQRVVFYRVR